MPSHYAAELSTHVISDDIAQSKLTNQRLTSAVSRESCESRDEGV